MKLLVEEFNKLNRERRWDIDYHLPAEKIQGFPQASIVKVSKIASVINQTRDPSRQPQTGFKYIDIGGIDVATGIITNVQELVGEEAPSRARMVVQAYDVIVSTVRPTRGAIAVVPPELHNEPEFGVHITAGNWMRSVGSLSEGFFSWWV